MGSGEGDRETLELDVLIVGGGPAGLSAALRIAQLQQQDGGEPLSIAVLEKSHEIGAHMLSGAVLDPSTLEDLVPGFRDAGAPLAAEVQEDRVYLFTATSKLAFPVVPPPLRNSRELHRVAREAGALALGEGWRPRGSTSLLGLPLRTFSWTAHACWGCARVIGAGTVMASGNRSSSRASTLLRRS